MWSRGQRRRTDRKWLPGGPVITRRQPVIPTSYQDVGGCRADGDDLQSNRYYTASVTAAVAAAAAAARRNLQRRHRIDGDVTADVAGASLRTACLSVRQSIVPLCVSGVEQISPRPPVVRGGRGLFVTPARTDDPLRVNIEPSLRDAMVARTKP